MDPNILSLLRVNETIKNIGPQLLKARLEGQKETEKELSHILTNCMRWRRFFLAILNGGRKAL